MNDKAKHWPGLLEAEPSTEHENTWMLKSGTEMVGGVSLSDPYGEPLVRLFTAAPDLLEALEACTKQLKLWMADHGQDIASEDAIEAARAAIAKAKGETK